MHLISSRIIDLKNSYAKNIYFNMIFYFINFYTIPI